MTRVAVALLVAAGLAAGMLAWLRHGVGRGTERAIEQFLVRMLQPEDLYVGDLTTPDLAIHYGPQEMQRRGRMYRRLLGKDPPPRVEVLREEESTGPGGEPLLQVDARLHFAKGSVDGTFEFLSLPEKGWRMHRFEVTIPPELQMPPNREMLRRAAAKLGEFWGRYRADNMEQVMHPALLARLPRADLQRLTEKDVERRGEFQAVTDLEVEEPEPRTARVTLTIAYQRAQVRVRLDFVWEDSQWLLSDLGEVP